MAPGNGDNDDDLSGEGIRSRSYFSGIPSSAGHRSHFDRMGRDRPRLDRRRAYRGCRPSLGSLDDPRPVESTQNRRCHRDNRRASPAELRSDEPSSSQTSTKTKAAHGLDAPRSQTGRNSPSTYIARTPPSRHHLPTYLGTVLYLQRSVSLASRSALLQPGHGTRGAW